jgi:hypothetical protein
VIECKDTDKSDITRAHKRTYLSANNADCQITIYRNKVTKNLDSLSLQVWWLFGGVFNSCQVMGAFKGDRPKNKEQFLLQQNHDCRCLEDDIEVFQSAVYCTF